MKFFLVVLSLLLLLSVWSNYSVKVESIKFISDDFNNLPEVKVGVVLGTSERLANGLQNPYFENRIDAAVELYNGGKISHILVSGDNGTKTYNEPKDMMEALVLKGIPKEKITLDYAGFDTYDSMVRANKIFGQHKFIVISQRFHNERAVYIARKLDIEAFGYNAIDIASSQRTMPKIREYLARTKAYIEVKLSVNPTYLGKKEVI